MSLHVIVKRNPYYKPGTWIECWDQGCQRAIIEVRDKRIHVVGNEGIMLDKALLAPFMMRPMKRGLDK